MTGRTPAFVCLNLQRDAVGPGARQPPRARQVLANAQACLAWARRFELRVVHVFSRRRCETAAPIPGFHANANEVLAFKTSSSMFDNEDVVNVLRRARAAFVLGFMGHDDCLAAAFDAPKSEVRLIFVTDAIASPGLGGQSGEAIDAVIAAVLGELAGKITTTELLAREIQTFAPFTAPIMRHIEDRQS